MLSARPRRHRIHKQQNLAAARFGDYPGHRHLRRSQYESAPVFQFHAAPVSGAVTQRKDPLRVVVAFAFAGELAVCFEGSTVIPPGQGASTPRVRCRTPAPVKALPEEVCPLHLGPRSSR